MTPKDKILDIAMNLNRIGNWAADGYEERKERIKLFLGNTRGYIENLDTSKFSKKFERTYKTFIKEYEKLEKEGKSGPKDALYWAENMMTWGNILTHRSILI